MEIIDLSLPFICICVYIFFFKAFSQSSKPLLLVNRSLNSATDLIGVFRHNWRIFDIYMYNSNQNQGARTLVRAQGELTTIHRWHTFPLMASTCTIVDIKFPVSNKPLIFGQPIVSR